MSTFIVATPHGPERPRFGSRNHKSNIWNDEQYTAARRWISAWRASDVRWRRTASLRRKGPIATFTRPMYKCQCDVSNAFIFRKLTYRQRYFIVMTRVCQMRTLLRNSFSSQSHNCTYRFHLDSARTSRKQCILGRERERTIPCFGR
jgi:hypothetical protein